MGGRKEETNLLESSPKLKFCPITN